MQGAARTTGILPVHGHALEGRGTKFARRTKILTNSRTVAAFAKRRAPLRMPRAFIRLTFP